MDAGNILTPMSLLGTQLCHYDDIPDPGSKGLIVEHHNVLTRVLVVKKDRQVYAYENSCPHTRGALDWIPDRFLDEDANYIMCANHGALFQIKDGLCIYGPCKNQHLRSLACTVQDQIIHLLL